jgi:hypothetical protein
LSVEISFGVIDLSKHYHRQTSASPVARNKGKKKIYQNYAAVQIPTLLNAPLEHLVEISQQNGAQRVVVLSEYIDDGIKRMVARRCHPFCFLHEK